jgi:mitochondrial fission protein ELM1
LQGDEDEVIIEEHEPADTDVDEAAEAAAAGAQDPIYVLQPDEKTKTQVVIYHDDSIRCRFHKIFTKKIG